MVEQRQSNLPQDHKYWNLLQPISFGNGATHRINLSHRVVMASLARGRADYTTKAPNDMHVEFYSKRATPGGMIITESAYIEQLGEPHFGSTSFYSEE